MRKLLAWFAKQSAQGAAQYVGGALLLGVIGGVWTYAQQQPWPVILFAFLGALAVGLLVMPYLVPLLPTPPTVPQGQPTAGVDRPAAIPPKSPQPVKILPPSQLPAWAAPPANEVPAERIFVAENVTIDYLVHLGDGLLGHQLEPLHESIKGKWMHISGAVGDVKRGAGRWRVVLPGELRDPQAFLSFSDEWQSRLTGLARGSVIRAIGQIDDIDPAGPVMNAGYVSFDHCELED